MKRRLLGAASLVIFFVLFLGGSASGEIQGPCFAQVQGRDVAPLSSTNPKDAIAVAWDETLSASASTPGPVGEYHVDVEFAGYRWTVSKGRDDDNNWAVSESVRPYAIYGVGLYKLIGSSTGGPCSAAALVKIVGKNPLSTVSGFVGTALAVVGGIGALTGLFRGAREGSPKRIASLGYRVMPTAFSRDVVVDTLMTRCGSAAEYTSWVVNTCGLRPPLAEIIQICGKPGPPWLHMQSLCTKGSKWVVSLTLWVPLILVLGMQPIANARASDTPDSSNNRIFPRIRFRPRIPIVGLALGVMLGAGGLLLGQQFGIVYPTKGTAIVAAVGGPLVSLVLSNIGRAIATGRMNKQIASSEATLGGDLLP